MRESRMCTRKRRIKSRERDRESRVELSKVELENIRKYQRNVKKPNWLSKVEYRVRRNIQLKNT